jgi:hypothetical protein
MRIQPRSWGNDFPAADQMRYRLALVNWFFLKTYCSGIANQHYSNNLIERQYWRNEEKHARLGEGVLVTLTLTTDPGVVEKAL